MYFLIHMLLLLFLITILKGHCHPRAAYVGSRRGGCTQMLHGRGCRLHSGRGPWLIRFRPLDEKTRVYFQVCWQERIRGGRHSVGMSPTAVQKMNAEI